MLDQAKLAVVAYAEVVGSNGTSTLTNSGIYTTRLGAGWYQVDLSKNPDGTPNQQELAQYSDRDLIVVTPHCTAADNGGVRFGGAKNVGVNGAVKEIIIGGFVGFTGVDTDFSVIIYRTLTPPATGGPA